MIILSSKQFPTFLREQDPEIVVGMPMRNMAATVASSVASVLNQRGVRGRLLLVVLDDASSDDSLSALAPFAKDRRLAVVCGSWGRVWSVRNTLLSAVYHNARSCRLIFRLDADDVLVGADTISSIDQRFSRSLSFPWGGRRPLPVALLAGNALSLHRQPLQRLNVPDRRLLTSAGLFERLRGMASGDPLAELPSCNLVLCPGQVWHYPHISSAEDHWLTASVLTRYREQVLLEEDILYCTYSLSGALTQENRARERHLAARRALLHTWRHWLDTRGKHAAS